VRTGISGIHDLPPEVTDSITEYLNSGKKIQAIKVYRNHTGASLKESKEAVESMAAGMGIKLRGGQGDKKSCLIMTVGFLVWAGLLVLSPFVVRELVQHVRGDSISSEQLNILMVFTPLILVVLTIILLVKFGKGLRKYRI